MKYFVYKFLFSFVLRLPDLFFATIFKIAFPVYRELHKNRAYGRVETHLANAKAYARSIVSKSELETTSAADVFNGIFWNAIDSYKGLAGRSRIAEKIIFKNEEIIRDALARGPVAAISIHQGAFELLHRALCKYSNNVHLVTDTLQDKDLRKVIQGIRGNEHITEYSPEESRSLIRNLFQKKDASQGISGNGILAMVIDQGKNTKGNSVQIFGQSSTLYLRLPQLVNQMGAGIVTFRTWNETARTIFGVTRKNIIQFETYYPPKTAPGLPRLISAEVESWIAEHPSQWSWNYHGNFRAPSKMP